MARKPKNKKETPIYKNKTTLTVYLVLRGLVIFVMVRALLRQEYQSSAVRPVSVFDDSAQHCFPQAQGGAAQHAGNHHFAVYL